MGSTRVLLQTNFHRSRTATYELQLRVQRNLKRPRKAALLLLTSLFRESSCLKVPPTTKKCYELQWCVCEPPAVRSACAARLVLCVSSSDRCVCVGSLLWCLSGACSFLFCFFYGVSTGNHLGGFASRFPNFACAGVSTRAGSRVIPQLTTTTTYIPRL